MSSVAERAARGVRPYVDADLPDLRRFQAEMYGVRVGQLATASIDWLRASSARDGSSATTLWICCRDGRIVGQQAQMRMSLRIGEDDIQAGAAIELMVDPAWRLKGVGPALAQVQRSSVRVTIALGVSDEARRLYLRAGWVDLGEVPRTILVVQPLRAIKSRTGWRGRTMVGCLMVAVGPGFAYRLVSAHRMVRGTRIEEISGFDERSETIWQQSRPFYKVLTRRDYAALRWRFDTFPHALQYRRFYVLRGEHPVGYLVVRPAHWWRLASLRIVDYLAPPELAPVLLAHACQVARRESIPIVEVRSRNQPAAGHIARHGYGYGIVPRLEVRIGRWPGIRLMAYAADDDPVRAMVATPGAWFVTSADSDLDLWT